MIKYYNITDDLNYVLDFDKKYGRDILSTSLKKALTMANIEIIDFSYISNSQLCMDLSINGENYRFISLLKNITGAGWENKPKIKRVQVSNIKNINYDGLYISCKNAFNMIIGYYNYDNNPIFVAWDAYRYLNHNTIRSCYVTVDSLRVGYIKRYYEGVDSAQKIWIFDAEHIKDFMISYTKYVNERYV